jgi:hypothetical protein
MWQVTEQAGLADDTLAAGFAGDMARVRSALERVAR